MYTITNFPHIDTKRVDKIEITYENVKNIETEFIDNHFFLNITFYDDQKEVIWL